MTALLPVAGCSSASHITDVCLFMSLKANRRVAHAQRTHSSSEAVPNEIDDSSTRLAEKSHRRSALRLGRGRSTCATHRMVTVNAQHHRMTAK